MIVIDKWAQRAAKCVVGGLAEQYPHRRVIKPLTSSGMGSVMDSGLSGFIPAGQQAN